MNDEHRFLESIRGSIPGDDAPHLVFADWLLEHGDPRGDFIVAQCTRSRLEEAGDRTSSAYRRAVIAEAIALTPARKRWFEILGLTDKPRSRFDRGLPFALEHRPDAIAAFARLPLRVITVPVKASIRRDDLRRLMGDLSPMSTLEEIELSCESATFDLDPARLRATFADPRWLANAAVHVDGKVAPDPPFDDACVEVWHGGDSNGEPLLRIADGDRVPNVAVFAMYARHTNLRAVLNAFGPERRTITRLALAFSHSESFAPLFHEWRFDGVQTLDLVTISDQAVHDTQAFAANHIGKGLTSFETTIPLDDHLAAGLAEARLDVASLHGGGSLTALERVLAHPIHTLSLRGFPSASLVELLREKAPPTLSQLTFSALDAADVPGLACARLGQLTRLWIQLTPDEAPELLGAPELAAVPWIHCGKTNRYPAPGTSVNPYTARRPRM